MKNRILPIVMVLLAGVAIYSCSKKENFPAETDDVIIIDDDVVSALVVRTSSLRNQEIVFELFDENGVDISAEATFFVDDEAIIGPMFSSAEVGAFEVYAEYMVEGTMVTSDLEAFQVIVPKRKIVIEDYTGAWCGYCPRVSAAIEAIHEVTDDVTVVAIHNDDDMAVSFEEDLRTEFGVSGFPAGRINRTTNWSNPHPIDAVIDIAGLDTDMAISINSQLNGSDLAVEISVVSENALDNTKLVVYLVENGILSDQVNYFDGDENSPYYQQGNPIVDFVNEDVLRASLSGIFGDNMTSTGALQEYKATYSTSLSSDYVAANMHIIAMVVQDDNTALNSQVANLDSFKDYE